jgi:hypothetical protein
MSRRSKLKDILSTPYWVRKHAGNTTKIIVKGRLRVWQVVVAGLGAAAIFEFALKKPLFAIFFESMSQQLCDDGPLGITIGWWHVFAMFAVPDFFVLAFSVWMLCLRRLIKRDKQYPLINSRPMLDTILLKDGAAERQAKKLLTLGILGAVAFCVLMYLNIDLAISYGQNMTPTQQEQCREGVRTYEKMSSATARLDRFS